MKTRSNDIILNAPFSYNSSTNTFPIGSDLYVNGAIKSQDAIMLYNDTQLTFYSEKENSEDITISPLFGYSETVTQLSFVYTLPDGTESYSAYLKLDKTSNILTDKNTKTVFGKSLYGTGNIDLYVHYLEITTVDDVTFYGFCYSSIKTSASGVGQGLTTLFKAPANQARNYITLGDITQDGGSALLQWTGTIWQVTYNGSQLNVTNVVDTVEPI